jgi:hypothetical protein
VTSLSSALHRLAQAEREVRRRGAADEPALIDLDAASDAELDALREVLEAESRGEDRAAVKAQLVARVACRRRLRLLAQSCAEDAGTAAGGCPCLDVALETLTEAQLASVTAEELLAAAAPHPVEVEAPKRWRLPGGVLWAFDPFAAKREPERLESAIAEPEPAPSVPQSMATDAPPTLSVGPPPPDEDEDEEVKGEATAAGGARQTGIEVLAPVRPVDDGDPRVWRSKRSRGRESVMRDIGTRLF